MMNLLNFAKSGLALLLAGSVTAGSVYVTVSAAVDSPEVNPAGNSATAEPVAAELSAKQTGLSQTEPSHTIVLNADGSLKGQLSQISNSDGQPVPAGSMEVKLIRDGKAIAHTVTDNDGLFSVKGLTPGVYAVVAAGANGYLSYGFRAAAGVATANPEAIQLHSAVVSPRDFVEVKRKISERFRRITAASKSPATSLIKQADAAEFLPVSAGSDEFEMANTISHRKVQLDANGSLGGLLTLIDARDGSDRTIRDLTIYFIANGRTVTSATIDPDGQFNVMGLSPGLYSIVAAGNDGVMAFGADIVGTAELAERQRLGDYTLANIAQSLELTGAPAAAENFSASGEPVPGDSSDETLAVPVEDAPCCFGAAPGGIGSGGGFSGGGGGGGGGGLGGLGTLLGAGIGGAIGFAIADDDDNPPASP